MPGMSQDHRSGNWNNVRRFQRGLGVRGERSGFTLLGPQQFSAAGELQAPLVAGSGSLSHF